MERGYIKLPRSILDWEWYKDSSTKSVLLHLLLRAAYAPYKYKGETIEIGQIPTTIRAISFETGLSYHQVRTALIHLSNGNMVATKKAAKFCVFTVNFDVCENTDGNIMADKSADRWQQDGNPYIDKKIKKIENINIQGLVRDDGFQPIVEAYRTASGRDLSSAEGQSAIIWRDSYDTALVVAVIKRAASAGKLSAKYVSSALAGLDSEGVHTADALKARDERAKCRASGSKSDQWRAAQDNQHDMFERLRREAEGCD